MNTEPLVLLNLVEALGIGLLIGAERERRRSHDASPVPAGIRTFAIASLAGAVSVIAGGELLLATTMVGVFALTAIAYWRARDEDIGLTTEIALVITVLLGGLSIRRPEIAAGVGVVVAILLAARAQLHTFVRSVLTEDELRDGLLLAAATLVVLPVVPDQPIGPYATLNPYAIWIVVILVMAIGAAGHVAIRLFGARLGLPLAGFASGFISSTATINAMGDRVAKAPNLLASAAAAASLSSIATIIQMAVLLAATNRPTLQALMVPLMTAGIVATLYGATFTILALRQRIEGEPAARATRAFSVSTALAFSLTLALILVASAALQEWLGNAGIILAAALAGLVNSHSAAISVALLVASGKIAPADAVLPILAGISTNSIVRMILARTGGNRQFALRVIPGLMLTMLAAWAGVYYVRLIG
ncbi:MAG: MgtC/SapB family protein [Hyphomicrobiaceae bacterium]